MVDLRARGKVVTCLICSAHEKCHLRCFFVSRHQHKTILTSYQSKGASGVQKTIWLATGSFLLRGVVGVVMFCLYLRDRMEQTRKLHLMLMQIYLFRTM